MKLIGTIIIIFICFASVLSAETSKSLLREGNKLYNDKKFNDAEIKFRKALELNPKIEGMFNLGDALYKQGNYEEAAEKFNQVATMSKNKDISSAAYHNLGNSFFNSKKYEESINAYKNALRINPNDEDTRYNLEYARRMLLKQQQQNQQQNQQNQNDNKNQQNQQQQQQQNQNNPNQNKNDQNKSSQNQQDKNKQNQLQQNQNNQNQDKMNEKAADQKQGDGKPREAKISKEDAERILNALMKEEKEVQKRIKKEKTDRVKTDKNW